jgi:uncharacterized RDD family membrane protein YckC
MSRELTPDRPAGSLRQLGAAVYDGLLILAIFMVVTFVPVALTGHDLSAAQVGPIWHAAHQGLLGIFLALYYGYAWTRRGQTLGMKAWNIRIATASGGPVGWSAALVRLLVAAAFWLLGIAGVLQYMHVHSSALLLLMLPLGTNYLANLKWLPWNSGTLVDRLSRTQILRH